ncbi:MAG: hypothetical protein LRY50_10085 [Geovibrio sp.]|nr:hypothetical protein [Geovibrio sp.]
MSADIHKQAFVTEAGELLEELEHSLMELETRRMILIWWLRFQSHAYH